MTVPESTYTIILIVAIVILFTLYIVGLIKSLRADSTGRRAAIPALTLGFLLCVYLTFNVREIRPADWAQIMLLFGLVVVTGVYALSTHKIARETKEQRYSESLPLLVPDVTRRSVGGRKLEPNEIDYGTLQTGVGMEVWWHNLGKGVAINTRFSFRSARLDSHPGKALFFPPRESTVLEVGGRKEIKFGETWGGQWYDIEEPHHPRLEAEYQDIYERNITTVQEFRIVEKNKDKRAFLGEMYFTINGRRLSKE